MFGMSVRTDLATEVVDFAAMQENEGVSWKERERGKIKISELEILNDVAAHRLGKPLGKYVTLSLPYLAQAVPHDEEQVAILAREIAAMLPQEGTILVIGLGNNDITPDALGPKTVDRILATRHFPAETAKRIGLSNLRSTAALAPGVLGQTGMEAAEIVLSLTAQIKPAAVLAIDALAAKSLDRLGSTVQISNSGISPGSGVQNKRKELSRQTLGVPVIAVGVPTVVDMSTLLQELSDNGQAPTLSEESKSMMVTPREIDLIIERAADILSLAVNKALQPFLSVEEIISLVL